MSSATLLHSKSVWRPTSDVINPTSGVINPTSAVINPTSGVINPTSGVINPTSDCLAIANICLLSKYLLSVGYLSSHHITYLSDDDDVMIWMATIAIIVIVIKYIKKFCFDSKYLL